MSKELSYSDVAEHTTKKDLYVVIHDKVYDSSSFVDEHPGGEEVLLDVAGQDATEAFEDVGHSDEAREILDGLKIGTLRRAEGDPAPKTATTTAVNAGPKPAQAGGMGMYVIALGAVVALLAAYMVLGRS